MVYAHDLDVVLACIGACIADKSPHTSKLWMTDIESMCVCPDVKGVKEHLNVSIISD